MANGVSLSRGARRAGSACRTAARRARPRPRSSSARSAGRRVASSASNSWRTTPNANSPSNSPPRAASTRMSSPRLLRASASSRVLPIPALPSITTSEPSPARARSAQREHRGELAVALEERPLARVHRASRLPRPQLVQRLGPVEPRAGRGCRASRAARSVAEAVLDERRRRRRQQRLAAPPPTAPTRTACSTAAAYRIAGRRLAGVEADAHAAVRAVAPVTRSTAAATAALGLEKTPSTQSPPRSTSTPPCSPSAATTVSSCLVS